MDRALIASAFLALFLAEMGDKTQLAMITMAASSRRPLEVFLGGAAALVAVAAIGAFGGQFLAKLVPPLFLKRGAALLFVAIGVWMWVRPD